MKHWFLFILLAITSVSLMAQDSTTATQKSSRTIREERRFRWAQIEKVKLPKDRIAVDFLGTNWVHNIGNGFKTKWYSRGISVYYYYDLRIKKSRVSFAPGIGFSSSNIYHRSEMNDDSLGTHFDPMDATKLSNIKRNKLSLNYIDIPLELRIRTNPDKNDNFWKFAIGFKAGVRIDAHTKQVIKENGETKVYKEKRFPDFSLFRAGPTLRVGYSVFNLVAYYGVVGVFKKDKGPLANEFSVGISFNGL